MNFKVRKEELYLASMKEVSIFLEEITPLLLDKKEENIDFIRIRVNTLISDLELDKSQLLTKWIEVNGETPFKVLQVTTVEEYFKVLSVVLLSSIQYISVLNDPLYLIAQISIISDWYKFQALDI